MRSLPATSGAALAATTAGATASLPGLIRQLDVGLTLTLVECVLAASVACRSRVHVALGLSIHTVKDRRLARMSLVTGRAGLGIRIWHLSFHSENTYVVGKTPLYAFGLMK